MNPVNVLLVEDSAEDLFFCRQHMERIDEVGQVFEAAYAEEAIVFLKSPERASIELIVLDLALPRSTGFDLLDQIAEMPNRERRDLKVLMVSGSIDPTDAQRARNHPLVTEFISKPLTQEALQAAIRRSFDDVE